MWEVIDNFLNSKKEIRIRELTMPMSTTIWLENKEKHMREVMTRNVSLRKLECINFRSHCIFSSFVTLSTTVCLYSTHWCPLGVIRNVELFSFMIVKRDFLVFPLLCFLCAPCRVYEDDLCEALP